MFRCELLVSGRVLGKYVQFHQSFWVGQFLLPSFWIFEAFGKWASQLSIPDKTAEQWPKPSYIGTIRSHWKDPYLTHQSFMECPQKNGGFVVHVARCWSGGVVSLGDSRSSCTKSDGWLGILEIEEHLLSTDQFSQGIIRWFNLQVN